MPIISDKKKTEDRKNKTLKLLSQYMCMKKAHTKAALIVAMNIATGKPNAPNAKLEVTTVKIVKMINATNTA